MRKLGETASPLEWPHMGVRLRSRRSVKNSGKQATTEKKAHLGINRKTIVWRKRTAKTSRLSPRPLRVGRIACQAIRKNRVHNGEERGVARRTCRHAIDRRMNRGREK